MDAIDRHRFLASAIVGRPVMLRESHTDTSLAFSDGQSIFLPKSPDNGPDTWPAIAAQAALIAAGSLDAALLRQLVGRPAAAQRYLYLEVLRASHVLKDRLPWGFTERAELRVMPRTGSAAESLALAATTVSLPMTPDYFGALRPLLALTYAIGERGLAALSSAKKDKDKDQEKARNGAATPESGAGAGANEAPELDEDDEGESSKILRLLQNPFTAGGTWSDLLNSILGAGTQKGNRESGPDGPSGAEIPVGRVQRVLRRGIHAIRAARPMMADIDASLERHSLKYPEWNVHTRSYRREWVSVQEVEPALADAEPTDAGHSHDGFTHDGFTHHGQFQRPSPALRRQLATLGLDLRLRGGQNEGSELDMRPLIDCATDLRAGHSPPSLNVYRASLQARRDLAVNVIVDISGSTGERRPDGGTAFADQLALAYQLGSTFDSLGDAVAMMGFHSWGRGLAQIVRIKRHDERWSLRVAQRLRLLEPVGYTRIGAAIRHGHHVLNTRIRLPHRLLILVTDGIAYDQDYEFEYAAADARKALGEARSAGTACVAMSVGGGARVEELAKVFGGGNLLAVDAVAQVSGRIRALCRHALAAVSKRRLSAPSAGRQRPR